MLSDSQQVLRTGAFEYQQLDAEVKRLRLTAYSFLVIEEVVPTGLSARELMLADIHSVFKRTFKTALWVRPGLWKPIMNNTGERHYILGKMNHAVSRHEGDAIMLGIYALRHRKRALAEIFKPSTTGVLE